MKHIAFFVPTLHGGGAERATLNLLKGMLKSDVTLDLVIANAEGVFLKQIPEQVSIVNLGAGRVMKAILPLSHYLKENKPYALISHMSHANVVAVLAKKLARTETKLVLVEHNTLSVSKSKLFRAKFLPFLMKWLYPLADAIVGVSTGVAQDLEFQLGLVRGKVSLIYNPVVDNDLLSKAKAPLEHCWFEKGNPPVFLAVGRLTEQKDFLTLIKAFALLRKQIMARLLILGEGECRSELEAMINKLKITDDVSLPGFVENPYVYMYNASAFILSSRWEGLPTVLIEAMACGCPVVATDCPSGSKEILAAGKIGTLVPVGDPVAMSSAMLNLLANSISVDVLVQRAMDFSVEQATSKYLSLLEYI
ncbi:glycosyltransferase [Desmonostoc muscorum CCALA 125]|nr:glycosyltransferase [Desmonostoc muscorum CCALA 125]